MVNSPIVMVTALEKEEGGKILPDKRLSRSQEYSGFIDLEAIFDNPLFKGIITIILEMQVKLAIDTLQEAGIIELTIKGLASAERKRRNIWVDITEIRRKLLPRQFEGKLDKNSFQKETERKSFCPAKVLARGIHPFLIFQKRAFQPVPLLVSEERAWNH